MSRYSFDAPDGVQWHVGWDPALASYFAQHEIPNPPPWDVDPVDVAGTERVAEITTVAELVTALRDRVELPAAVAQQLTADRPRDTQAAITAATNRLSQMEATLDGGSGQRPPPFWGTSKPSTEVLANARHLGVNAVTNASAAAPQHAGALHVEHGSAAGFDR